MRSTSWFVSLKRYRRITDLLIRSGLVDVTRPIGRSRSHDHQATLLHLAAASGKLRRVKLLLRHGADLRAKDSKDKSVLHYAVTCNSAALTDYLVSAGADVNARDLQGLSVLHHAIIWGSNEAVDILLRNGADLDAVDERGWSAIHIAVLVSSIGSTLLIEHDGVSINTRDILHWLPNHVTIDLMRERIVCKLLDHGANVNVKTEEGHFPLFYAVVTGHRNLVKLLISKGANVNEQTTNRETALIAACQRGLSKIAEILLYHQADVNLKNEQGDVALSSARQDDRTAEVIVRYIAKLEARQQFVDEDNHRVMSTDEKIQRYRDLCESELTRMKSEKIEESCNMSYYYILSKDTETIAALTRNYKVVKAFEEEELRDKYPVYAEELKTKFLVATARRNFAYNMENCLKNIFTDKNLPDIAIIKIVTYLKIEDLHVHKLCH